MEKQNLTSDRNWGGKRSGAGRPFGTTKENTKKMYSFRLSEEEASEVKELLKKLQKKKLLK